MNIGIVGGGMMGLATAHYLCRQGFQVTILEKEAEIGGLSRSVELLPDLHWDRYYHVILSMDSELLSFLDEMGLSPDVRFRETRTGFFTDGMLHSMSTIMEFLKFKPLSLSDKLRLAAGILYVNQIRDWNRLEKLYVRTWLTQIFGRRVYEKIWDPLLRSKLGAAKEQAAASFIWATIRRYYGTRHTASKRELMGCVSGGYSSVLRRIEELLSARGVKVLTGHEVRSVEPGTDGRISVDCGRGSTLKFDRLIMTVSNPDIMALCPFFDSGFLSRLQAVRYLSLLCVTLVLKKSVSPYYIINLTDPGFPFTGVIDATNVVPEEVLGGRGLLYLPRYMAPGDSFQTRPDEQVMRSFLDGLRRVFPDFREKDILAHVVNREKRVQPIQEVEYSEKIPPFDTPVANLHMVNTTMIQNSTLNNNQVIGLARRMAAHLSGRSIGMLDIQ